MLRKFSLRYFLVRKRMDSFSISHANIISHWPLTVFESCGGAAVTKFTVGTRPRCRPMSAPAPAAAQCPPPPTLPPNVRPRPLRRRRRRAGAGAAAGRRVKRRLACPLVDFTIRAVDLVRQLFGRCAGVPRGVKRESHVYPCSSSKHLSHNPRPTPGLSLPHCTHLAISVESFIRHAASHFDHCSSLSRRTPPPATRSLRHVSSQTGSRRSTLRT